MHLLCSCSKGWWDGVCMLMYACLYVCHAWMCIVCVLSNSSCHRFVFSFTLLFRLPLCLCCCFCPHLSASCLRAVVHTLSSFYSSWTSTVSQSYLLVLTSDFACSLLLIVCSLFSFLLFFSLSSCSSCRSFFSSSVVCLCPSLFFTHVYVRLHAHVSTRIHVHRWWEKWRIVNRVNHMDAAPVPAGSASSSSFSVVNMNVDMHDDDNSDAEESTTAHNDDGDNDDDAAGFWLFQLMRKHLYLCQRLLLPLLLRRHLLQRLRCPFLLTSLVFRLLSHLFICLRLLWFSLLLGRPLLLLMVMMLEHYFLRLLLFLLLPLPRCLLLCFPVSLVQAILSFVHLIIQRALSRSWRMS